MGNQLGFPPNWRWARHSKEWVATRAGGDGSGLRLAGKCSNIHVAQDLFDTEFKAKGWTEARYCEQFYQLSQDGKNKIQCQQSHRSGVNPGSLALWVDPGATVTCSHAFMGGTDVGY